MASTDFSIGFRLPDTPKVRQWRLKMTLRFRRESLILSLQRDAIRLAFERLAMVEFCAGKQWP